MIADFLLGTRVCLFTFHRAAPSAIWETLPNRDFYLHLGFFDRLLSYLRRTGWSVVTIEEALQRAARAGGGGRYVNFSIDDGYRDTFEEVVPLFRRHNLPITLFITTGIPDQTLLMLYAGLEDTILGRNRVIVDDNMIEVGTPDAKRNAYTRIAKAWEGSQADERYAEFCSVNGVDANVVHARHAISWDMLKELRHDPLVEIGAHGVTHERVSSLEPSSAFAELTGSRDRLREMLGIDVRHFAFPYGRAGDCGPRDFNFARQAGFLSASTTRKGLVRRGHDVYCLPRNTLNGAHQNLAMMDLHLSGLTGMAAKLVGRV
jgi:peptidoglycan/xylan/chitin deacetylase (PgdA/CDA1 family)